MSYVTKTLQEGEEILFRANVSTKPVWVEIVLYEAVVVLLHFFTPAFALDILEINAIPPEFLPFGTLVVILIALIFGFIPTILERFANEMVVTTKRIVHRRGIIFRNTVEIDRGAIESINVSQGIFGRIFNYGTVTVRGRGLGNVELKNIDDPISLRNNIQAG